MGCRTREFRFESNFSLFMYQEPSVARLIAGYKGRGRRSLAFFLAESLLRAYRPRYDGLPLVPVPCRKSSLRKRGFDHIALLCGEMKRQAQVEVLPLLLRRGKTREQKTLNREEREKNLRGSIIPAKRSRLKNLPPEVVLLDDVFTTGATAEECAGVLKSLGIQKVYVLTIALD
jgi:ComF family protein